MFEAVLGGVRLAGLGLAADLMVHEGIKEGVQGVHFTAVRVAQEIIDAEEILLGEDTFAEDLGDNLA